MHLFQFHALSVAVRKRNAERNRVRLRKLHVFPFTVSQRFAKRVRNGVAQHIRERHNW
jgi:hypothetical protein